MQKHHFVYIYICCIGTYKMYLYYHISYTVLELLDFIEIYLYKVNQLFSFTYTYTHVQWYQYANHSLFFSVVILFFFPFLSFFLSFHFFLFIHFFFFSLIIIIQKKVPCSVYIAHDFVSSLWFYWFYIRVNTGAITIYHVPVYKLNCYSVLFNV